MKTISRRTFVKGGAVATVGALGGFALAGCAPATQDAATSEASSSAQAAATSDAAATATQASATSSGSAAAGNATVTLHRGYAAAHGDMCFTQVVVAVAEDGSILAANVDDYQFMAADTEGIIPVPNSDADFAEGYAEGMTLMSKTDNDKLYSERIAAKAESTQSWATSMQAIQAYAQGKQPADLQNVSLDAVSGATLVDAPNYLAAIASVAQSNEHVSEGSYYPDAGTISLGRVNAVCHGSKAFGTAVSLVQDGTIVAASIDEFQFLDAETGAQGVPNSDAAFGENYAEGVVLCSKYADDDVYSAFLADLAGSTQHWAQSMDAIETAVAGTPIGTNSIDGPDAVSGATLADTAGYVAAAQLAAQQA